MNTWLKLAAVATAQLALVGLGVAPQLSAHTTGDEYRFRVEPYDPIDPFRGAYVDLTYPDLALNLPDDGGEEPDETTLYLTLVEQDGEWVKGDTLTERPSDGPYLACDNHGWRLRCGIESYFLPEDQAASFQELVGSGDAVAVVKVDSRGHAALIRVEHE